tara:strand:+ start:320 stop:577 length:258 start_codon:yes stop_codon:yes gene_type:complete
MPTPKPISLEGQTNPSYASAKCFVAKIETYDTAIPAIDIIKGLSLDQLLKNCKCDWNHMSICPIVKYINPKNKSFGSILYFKNSI